MSSRSIRMSNIVWLILCLATLLSALLSYSANYAVLPQSSGIAILAIAFGKAHLVMNYFMELKGAPIVWRSLFGAWTIVTFLVLAAFFATCS